METINHLPFIAGAYAATFVVIGALVAWVILDFRAQRRALADLEARGLSRRSAASRRTPSDAPPPEPKMAEAEEEA
jgi:heme exporter protein D